MKSCASLLQVVLLMIVTTVKAWVELPKFNQMMLLYPGYHHHGGKYKDRDVWNMIGPNSTHDIANIHNTAAARMSVMLNNYGGRHAIGKDPIYLSTLGRDSVTGKNSQEYIFRNTAFGPFLAAKYGNPTVAQPNKQDHTKTMDSFRQRQGIVRFVSYHGDHAGGHMALWDCNHFFQSRDWTTEHHVIAVEFWEAADSYCAASDVTPPKPHLETLDVADMDLVVRHNYQDDSATRRRTSLTRGRARHRGHRQRKKESLWLQ